MPNFFVTIISKSVPRVLQHLSAVWFFAMSEVAEHAWPGLEVTVPHLTVNREEGEKEGKREGREGEAGRKQGGKEGGNVEKE